MTDLPTLAAITTEWQIRDCKPFSAVLFGFVGVLLLSGSGLLVSYAVNRDDYLHEVLVLIAFVPFILGFLMILLDALG